MEAACQILQAHGSIESKRPRHTGFLSQEERQGGRGKLVLTVDRRVPPSLQENANVFARSSN